MRGYILSDSDKWKAAFVRAYPLILTFLAKYFWVLYCTVFAILTAFSYFFAIEVNTSIPAAICALAVTLIAFTLGVLLHRCLEFPNRFLYFVLTVFAVFQIIFHVPASLPALGIALFLGALLLLPNMFVLLPFGAAAGCLYSEYFAYWFVTVTMLFVYLARATKEEWKSKACLYSFSLSAVIVSTLQIVLYGGFQSYNTATSTGMLPYIAASTAALSTVICFDGEKQEQRICIAVNIALILWCLLWPDLLAPAISACIVFYNLFIKAFLRKARAVFLQKTGVCLLCFAVFVCIIHIGGFNLPRTYYAIYTYYLNYLDMGFVRRSLIGTVFYMLFGYKIPWENMRLFIAVLCYLEAALSVYLIVKYIQRLQTDNTLILAAFSTLLIVIIPSLLSPILMGHMENHLSLILLLCLCCIFKGKKAVWLTIPLCATGICIHTAFIFYCFPLVFLTILYAKILQPHKPEKYAFLLLFLLTIVTCGLFVYMTYFSYAFSMMPADRGIQYLIERSGNASTNTYARKILFHDVLNANPAEHLNYAKDKLGIDLQLKNIARMRFFIPHLLLYFTAFWISSEQIEIPWKKSIMRLLPFGIITFLPLYLFETDHGRWNTMLVLWLCMGTIVISVFQQQERWYQKIPVVMEKLIALIMIFTSINAGLFQVFS